MSFTDHPDRSDPDPASGELFSVDTEPQRLVDSDADTAGPDLSQEKNTSREPARPSYAPRRRRRWVLPLLFVATCASTFVVGCTLWNPYEVLTAFASQNAMPLRRAVLAHGSDGFIYMACIIAILLTHEMGHYLATVRYRIHATLPIFIPFPISPFGTMGAVIGMKGMQADRRQLFDIGIAGPLAGLVVAIPVMWIGIQQLNLSQPGTGGFRLDLPIAVKWTMALVQPRGYGPDAQVWQSQLNPYFMAGWVGFLITGLNMMPVSQLDGGHVTYTLFGKRAHWFARAFMLVLMSMIAIDWVLWFRFGDFLLQVGNRWWLMAILVLLIGTDHPPTSDDSVPLGWFRTTLGCLSLLIPILCFAPRVLYP